MRARKSIVIGTLAAALVFGTQAVALNPQPEPPRPYHGYEYVIGRLDDYGWSWEIRKRADNNRPLVLSHGSVRGSHARAVNAARRAIDHLAAPQSQH